VPKLVIKAVFEGGVLRPLTPVPLRECVRLHMETKRIPDGKAWNAVEFERELDELSKDSEGLPPLPETFSREDIYFDHD
jgi:predicted DNA-binding antitoxin AbrB/MazE fold protein